MKTPSTDFSRHSTHLLCLALFLTVLAVYGPSLRYGFAGLDDDQYVTGNPQVRTGLTLKGILWAFSFNDEAYWHPLTWLSHMLDCELYGVNPWGHHLNNLLFHAVTTLILFLFLRRSTGDLWRSGAVAAFFAVHPLNVESVVWVASRKNLLSTLFWMLSLWAYARYSERPRHLSYLPVFLSLGLGLMTKPMLVTLPVVLLLLDYWPLGRLFPGDGRPLRVELLGSSRADLSRIIPLILEKLPLMMLCAASVLISILSAGSRDLLVATQSVPLTLRVENALVSYLLYLSKMFWPSDLALFYPYPASVPHGYSAGAGLLLLCATALIVRNARRVPYLFVGWGWYAVTLLPVIGLVQQGLWPAWADRFAYLPLIGPFLILSWGVPDMLCRRRLPRVAGALLALLAIVHLGLTSRAQLQTWKDNEDLFKNAVERTSGNHLAHFNLARLLHSKGRIHDAAAHYSEALRILPANALFHSGLASALLDLGRVTEAVRHLREAVRISPNDADALTNLGSALRQQGEWEEALRCLHRALSLRPIAEAHHNLGLLLAGRGRTQEAISHYRQALHLKPWDGRIHNDLGVALYSLGQREQAVFRLTEALRLLPSDPRVRHNLRVVREEMETSAMATEKESTP